MSQGFYQGIIARLRLVVLRAQQIFLQHLGVIGHLGTQQPDLLVDVRDKRTGKRIGSNPLTYLRGVQGHQHRLEQLPAAHLAVEHLNNRYMACLDRPVLDKGFPRTVDAAQDLG